MSGYFSDKFYKGIYDYRLAHATKPDLYARGLYPNPGVKPDIKDWNGYGELYYPLEMCHPITPAERDAEIKNTYLDMAEKKFYEELEKALKDDEGLVAVLTDIEGSQCLSYHRAGADIYVGDRVVIDLSDAHPGGTCAWYYAIPVDMPTKMSPMLQWPLINDSSESLQIVGDTWPGLIGTVVARFSKEELLKNFFFHTDAPLKSNNVLVKVSYHCVYDLAYEGGDTEEFERALKNPDPEAWEYVCLHCDPGRPYGVDTGSFYDVERRALVLDTPCYRYDGDIQDYLKYRQ